MGKDWKMKIWTTDRSNNVYTQRTPLQYRATLHRTTRITLASLLFGRYACLLCFLRPLISRRGLLATSWRRSFGLESSWRDLQDLHAFAPLRPQYFSKFSSNFLAFSKLDMLKSSIFFKFRRDFRWFSWNLVGFSQIFLRNAAITRNISISI